MNVNDDVVVVAGLVTEVDKLVSIGSAIPFDKKCMMEFYHVAAENHC